MSKARHIYNVYKFTNAGLDRSKMTRLRFVITATEGVSFCFRKPALRLYNHKDMPNLY